MKLPGQVAPANDPDIQIGRGSAHLVVDSANVPTHESHVGSRYCGQLARCEYPGWLRVGPRRTGLRGDGFRMTNHPLVGRRTHRKCTDTCDELRIARAVQVAER